MALCETTRQAANSIGPTTFAFPAFTSWQPRNVSATPNLGPIGRINLSPCGDSCGTRRGSECTQRLAALKTDRQRGFPAPMAFLSRRSSAGCNRRLVGCRHCDLSLCTCRQPQLLGRRETMAALNLWTLPPCTELQSHECNAMSSSQRGAKRHRSARSGPAIDIMPGARGDFVSAPC